MSTAAYPTLGVTAFEARVIANFLAGTFKVTIAAGLFWAYNHQHKTIFYRPEDLNNLYEDEVVANLMHEVGHARYTGDPATYKWTNVKHKSHRDKLIFLLNALEDFRVEDLMRSYYLHAKFYLPEYSFKTRFIIEKVNREYRYGKKPKYQQYCWAIYTHLAKAPLPKIDPDVALAVQKTKAWTVKCRKAVNTQRSVAIVDKYIYPHIKDWLDDWEDPTEGWSGRSVVTAQGTSPHSSGENQETQEGLRIVGGAGYTDSKNQDDHYRFKDAERDIRSLIPPTIASLNRLLTDVKFDKLVGGYRSGPALNEKRLYRARLGDDRVFTRRVEASNKDYIFALLVDTSGSMEGKPLHYAYQTAVLFSLVLERMGMPYMIYGFHNFTTEYKNASESLSAKMKRKLDEMYTSGGGGTDMTEGLKQTLKEMSKHQNQKILFVITDGEPDDVTATKRMLAEAKHQGVVTVGISVGDENGSVTKLFDYSVVTTSNKAIPKLLIKNLKGRLKAGLK